MQDKLSFIEKMTFNFIEADIEYNACHGGEPISQITNRELANKLEMSVRTVVRFIKKLERLQCIEITYKENNTRYIRVKGGIKQWL